MTNPPFPHSSAQKLLDHYQPIWSLEYLTRLAEWDLETYMPEAGVSLRGSALAKTKSFIQQLYLEPSFKRLLAEVEQQGDLTVYEKGMARVFRKTLDEFEKLPKEFVEEFEQTISKAQVAWRSARARNNFAEFQPYLEKIVQLSIQKADYLGYDYHPYDALLNTYEEGSTVQNLDAYFGKILPFLRDLLAMIQQTTRDQPSHFLKTCPYNLEALKKIDANLLTFLKVDLTKLRLDTSAHPFTQGLGVSDVRITTRYSGQDFASSLMSTIHEFGHALYELQIDPRLSQTPIGSGISLGIHESQSRFWENFVGRCRSFSDQFYPQIQTLSTKIGSFSPEDVYQYFNQVRPGLIRVEADEVTYHFHIVIRYELEKMLLNKELMVAGIPEVWNQKYQDYLGVEPKTFAEGCLQDIHWSMGGLGYFPTYSTGTVLSATWKQLVEQQLGKVEELIKQPEGIDQMQTWLSDHVHQYGGTYPFHDLIKKETGKPFSVEPWKAYLEEKYGKI